MSYMTMTIYNIYSILFIIVYFFCIIIYLLILNVGFGYRNDDRSALSATFSFCIFVCLGVAFVYITYICEKYLITNFKKTTVTCFKTDCKSHPLCLL